MLTTETKKDTKNATIETILKSNYVLITYHNSYFQRHIEVTSDDQFNDLVLTRLSAVSEKIADLVIITPAEGCYNLKQEPSFMLTFKTKLSLVEQLQIMNVFEKLAFDLGQDSFIFRVNQVQGMVNDEHNLMIARSGSIMADGQGVTILDNDTKTDYTLVNGVKFTLGFQNWY